MGYAVLHLDKASGNEAKMTAHIERTQMPKNADPMRTHLNKNLIEYPDGVTSRTEAIEYRLKKANLKRAIGKNQVCAIRIMLTGSHEDMKRIETEGKLGQWCDDNLTWLRKTYGADNLVSAVLHLDEATAHIHATVVPIVIGERRKAKERKEEPGKKKYRKKDPNGARLCADDVMTRIKLKEYQDTYAGAMSKYGLKRGIAGSEARHITTQEFYRNAIAQKENLQENIDLLLQVEESKLLAVEDLKKKEQEAQSQYTQAEILKQQKENELGTAEAKLKEMKGQLKAEKFKSSAAQAGTVIMDGITSALGTSKVKRQQQEIETLITKNKTQQQEILNLKRTIEQERKKSDKVTRELKTELTKIYGWLPEIKLLIKWGEFCKSIGFSDSQVKDLINMRSVNFSGKLYSMEHSQWFKTNKSEARMEKDTERATLFVLLIDNIDVIHWFRQKYEELLKIMDINLKVESEKETYRIQGLKK